MDVDVELDIPKFQNGWLVVDTYMLNGQCGMTRGIIHMHGCHKMKQLGPNYWTYKKKRNKEEGRLVFYKGVRCSFTNSCPCPCGHVGNSTYKYTSYPCIVQSTIINVKRFKTRETSIKLLFLIRPMLFDFVSIFEGCYLLMVPEGPKNVHHGSFTTTHPIEFT